MTLPDQTQPTAVHQASARAHRSLLPAAQAPRTVARRRTPCVLRSLATLSLTLATLAAGGLLLPPLDHVAAATPGELLSKYAGTYQIDTWPELEARGLYHFFYLHESGRFLLAGDWAGNESSRIAGRWQVDGEWLTLRGEAHVQTNQGRWDVPFERAFRIGIGNAGFELRPRLDKNRYGLLGWPNTFRFYRPALVSNLPKGGVPEDEAALLALIDKLAGSP